MIDQKNISEKYKDIDEMKQMLNDYLSLQKLNQRRNNFPINLKDFIHEIKKDLNNKIHFDNEIDLIIKGRFYR